MQYNSIFAEVGFRPLWPEEVAQLMRKLQANPHVLLLNFRFNSSVGGELRGMPVLTNLQVLGLHNCSVDARGAAALAHALPRLKSLQVLDIAFNDIGAAGMQLLAPSLLHMTALQQLWLNNNNIFAAGIQSLAPSLLHMTALQQLWLNSNNIGAAGMQSLAPSLLHMTALQQLSLYDNNIGAAAMQLLAPSLLHMTALQQLSLYNNNIDVPSVCLLLPSLLDKSQLSTVELGHQPSSCVRHSAWAQAEFPVPPAELIRQGWRAVLQFLHAGPTVPVHELRLMLIGDAEAGKTSLQQALKAPSHRADRIGKEERTVGIDISEMQFSCADGPAVKCQVCDFAGQAVYYLSHTLHFTRRCLYLLMWTSHKFSESGAAQALSVADTVAPLKRWLQLLAANVPEASVVVVGTHCRVEPDAFEAMRLQVEQEVKQEMERLHYIADAESAATRQVLQRQHTKAQAIHTDIKAQLSASALQLDDLADVAAFVKQLKDVRPVAKRSLRRKAELLLETMLELAQTKLRLCRLHAVYDGSLPGEGAAVAHLKLVTGRSFAVDSVEGVGVAELLGAIEATCRDRQALPFMGEQVPVSWTQVNAALQQQQTQPVIGDCVMSLNEAVAKVRAALQLQLDLDVEFARRLDGAGVQRSLEFWSLLGRVFVHDGHFLRDPRLIINLLKPLVHHNVLDRKFKFRELFLVNATDVSCDRLLQQLHSQAVLDHGLLPYLVAWAKSSAKAHASMLSFFKATFMITAIRALGASESGSGDEPQRSLVTARLLDSDGDRQREADALANGIAACAVFHAVYALPSAHVGIMSHMMASVEQLQPSQIALAVTCAHNHLCIVRGPSQCAVSVLPLANVFASKLGSIQHHLPPGDFSHALVISSNDDGLFAFAARCVDSMMRSGSFGAMYQCWLPCRSSATDAGWQPKREDWAEVNSPQNVKTLSEVLSANASDVVITSHSLRLKDIFPRRPRIFMSHTFSGDGTGECCQRIKNGLEERLLCTVWFDKAEMGWTDAFVSEMKRGMANASAFVICLSPLYLTRPNCLRELMWAMDTCSADQTKKLCVLPMHPCVSFAGCKAIVDLAAAGCDAQVILPADDRSKEAATQLQQLKAHKLSDVAVSLLQRLTGSQNVGINAEWLKLQPWLSDSEGENWEETSQPWAGPCEGKSVEMAQLLQALAVDVKAAVLATCAPAPWSAFTDVEDQLLRSLPPSQDYQTPSDTKLLKDNFPQLLRNFTQAEAVKLMLLGLRDADAIGCITHGFKRSSTAAASELNPVDAVFRMAANMSECFTSSRVLVSSSLPGSTNPTESTAVQPAQPPSTPLPSAAHPVSAASTATQPLVLSHSAPPMTLVPVPRQQLQSAAHAMTASDVAARIGQLGPAYLALQQVFVDFCVDGVMLADLSRQPEDEVLRLLREELGITNSMLRRRVLLELKSLWSQPPA